MDEERDIFIYENREVQELIGYVPTSLQKWGVYVIALFVLMLLTGSYFFQYPETLKGNMVVPVSDETVLAEYGTLYLPPANIGEVKKGLKVLFFTRTHAEAKYGFLTGVVNDIQGTPDASGHYKVEVCFPQGRWTNKGIELSPELQLTGTGEVILKEKRLIETLIKPVELIHNIKP